MTEILGYPVENISLEANQNLVREMPTEKLGNWIEFLIKPESERVKMGAKKDKNLKEAVEKLEVISGDARMQRIAELRLKYILDENTNIRTEKKIEKERISKNLLKLKIPTEQISEATGLSKEEIEKLK